MEKHKLINQQPSVTRSFLEKSFDNLEYLPRWLVFCIDVSILVVASFISYALINNLTFAILVIINYGSYFFMGKKYT